MSRYRASGIFFPSSLAVKVFAHGTLAVRRVRFLCVKHVHVLQRVLDRAKTNFKVPYNGNLRIITVAASTDSVTLLFQCVCAGVDCGC